MTIRKGDTLERRVEGGWPGVTLGRLYTALRDEQYASSGRTITIINDYGQEATYGAQAFEVCEEDNRHEHR